MTAFVELRGEVVAATDLSIPRAAELARRLAGDAIAFAALVECRRAGDSETVVLDVEVEVPQIRAHPVLPVERIAVTFAATDDSFPEVEALRRDFPQVPHLNLRVHEYPKSLCLYASRHEEVLRRWTAARFVRRIREWLALTARGELHQEDQPLEPLLGDHVGCIVLPGRRAATAGSPERLAVVKARPDTNGRLFLIAYEDGRDANIIATTFACEPQTHGVLRQRPATVEQVAALTSPAGLDLLPRLRDRLASWHAEGEKVFDSHLVVVVLFPKRRSDGGEVEEIDTWAFFLDGVIRDVGTKMGVWEPQDGQVGLLLAADTSKTGEDIGVDVLSVAHHLSRASAAVLNAQRPQELNIAAVGAGALGSQVMLNLARSGYGRWTILDHDRLMPHNVARHGLDAALVGWHKAEALAAAANCFVADEDPFAALPADVLRPAGNDTNAAFAAADAIVDMSASVAVGRFVARDVESPARRLSLFLSPSGQDLVLLAEDSDRQARLDALEMQYYRAIANDEALAGHLTPPAGQTRYGQSCRDVTSRLPQELVALHAAIGATAIRTAISSAEGAVTIWRADDARNVRRTDVPRATVVTHDLGDWTIVTDATLRAKVSGLRAERLPNETGGVLLGSFDLERRILYIVDALPSPPDSEEWPTLYIRGCEGLRQSVARVEGATDGMLEYVGEWHSHPAGASTVPSGDDLKVFAWLTTWMGSDGLPATMMIVGDAGRCSCFVGEIVGEERLLPEAVS